MNIIDFFIGLTLVNTLPHFVLGIWKGRILSGLGTSPSANIFYGLLNLLISLGLFIYQYGWEGLFENGLYLGGLFMIFCYLIAARFLYQYFHKGYFDKKNIK